MSKKRKLILDSDLIQQSLLKQLEHIRITCTYSDRLEDLVEAAVEQYVYFVDKLNVPMDGRFRPILSEYPNGEPRRRRFSNQDRAKWGKVISLMPYLERGGQSSEKT